MKQTEEEVVVCRRMCGREGKRYGREGKGCEGKGKGCKGEVRKERELLRVISGMIT